MKYIAKESDGSCSDSEHEEEEEREEAAVKAKSSVREREVYGDAEDPARDLPERATAPVRGRLNADW